MQATPKVCSDAAWNQASRRGDRETPGAGLLALWASVLEAGLNDALRPFPACRQGETEFRHATRVRSWESAVQWVGSPDFRAVCEMSGFDPQAVACAYEAARARRLRKLA